MQYFKGRHIDTVISAEIGVSPVLARSSGWPVPPRCGCLTGRGRRPQGSRLTAILWILSVAAPLGFDHVVAGHNRNGLGHATILLYLVVTFGVQRLRAQARAGRAAIPAHAGPTSFA